MKKRIFLFIVVMVMAFMIYSMAFSQGESVKINVFFKEFVLKVKDEWTNLGRSVFIYNNRIYAPISEIVRIMGGEAALDEENKTVEIKTYKDFSECDYLKGEKFVYGLITEINYEKNEVEIEQHFDDNSVEVFQVLKVRKDVIILFERNENKMNISFNDLKVGDVIGATLDKNGYVRGIILSR